MVGQTIVPVAARQHVHPAMGALVVPMDEDQRNRVGTVQASLGLHRSGVMLWKLVVFRVECLPEQVFQCGKPFPGEGGKKMDGQVGGHLFPDRFFLLQIINFVKCLDFPGFLSQITHP